MAVSIKPNTTTTHAFLSYSLSKTQISQQHKKVSALQIIQSDSVTRGPTLLSIKKLCVLGCERRPVSASIMSRSCFASFPVCVYKFSSHYMHNVTFYRQQFGASSDRITLCKPVFHRIKFYN